MDKDMLELYKKINNLRKIVKDKLEKTGENSYSHYSYFKLDDFLPQIVDHCAKEQDLFIWFELKQEKRDLPNKTTTTPIALTDGTTSISTIVEENFDYVEYATLEVVDLKTGCSKVFKKETEEAKVQGASPIQNLGAKSTYMKRYMYIDLLELAETDQVEESEPSKEVPKATTKVSTTPKVSSATPKAAPKKEEVPVATQTSTQEDALMSLEDKGAITNFITSNGLEPSIIVEIAKSLGYESPVQLRAKDKDKVMEMIKEKVGK